MASTFSTNSKQASSTMRSPEELQALILKKIEGFCKKNGDEAILQPVNYILQLGGKRVRPLLTLLAANAFDESSIDDAVYPAVAMEIFHNFTLMHDDIMDNAPLRRGKPTVHEKWNRDVAILSGDAMLIQAYQLIVKTRPECLPDVLDTFNQTALEVCKGQQLDMDFQNRNDVTVEEYIEMIRLKTSVLLGGAMKTGAIIGGASIENRQRMYDFAIDLGISFQLWDDWLDTFGNGEKIGKQVGGDILANKKTFLMIKALELADNEQKNQLSAWMSGQESPENKVRLITELFRTLHLPELLQEKVDHYYHRALKSLETIDIPSERIEHIAQLAASLYRREF